MKYNMQTIRRIKDIEDAKREALGPIYNCDPDELPFDFDLLDIFEEQPENRREILVQVCKFYSAYLNLLLNI